MGSVAVSDALASDIGIGTATEALSKRLPSTAVVLNMDAIAANTAPIIHISAIGSTIHRNILGSAYGIVSQGYPYAHKQDVLMVKAR